MGSSPEIAIALPCGMPFDRMYWQQAVNGVTPYTFGHLALGLFRDQYAHNPVYGEFCRILRRTPAQVLDVEDIPFLPISLFRDRELRTGSWPEEAVFTSSGTTGARNSRHFVADQAFYLANAERGFRAMYGAPERFAWLCLLPGYLERSGSSLVAMADHFIRRSTYPESGFFLHDLENLHRQLADFSRRKAPVVLLGVTHALLRFADRFPGTLDPSLIVMETGGMKGQGPELIREEVHRRLRSAWGLEAIHSEYGMTELLSQAYALGDGHFRPAPTLRATVRDIYDPFHFPGYGRTGLLCFIDLANLATQAFIATQDLGRIWPDGRFEVLGRQDGSDVRGCNLMVQDLE